MTEVRDNRSSAEPGQHHRRYLPAGAFRCRHHGGHPGVLDPVHVGNVVAAGLAVIGSTADLAGYFAPQVLGGVTASTGDYTGGLSSPRHPRMRSWPGTDSPHQTGQTKSPRHPAFPKGNRRTAGTFRCEPLQGFTPSAPGHHQTSGIPASPWEWRERATGRFRSVTLPPQRRPQ